MKCEIEKILIATRNLGKVYEIQELVKNLPVSFLSLSDVPAIPEVEEDGETFAENALKKARITSAATGLATLADDSGLCVDALNGRPGVLSARYAGGSATDAEKCAAILLEMKNVPHELRTGRFVCVMALVFPGGSEHLFEGICEGHITTAARGTSGFGYDPIFFYDEIGLTFAETDRKDKNRVSHRGRALQKVADFLEKIVESGLG
jgi:XTP/dITP diphosphohydrolase